MLKRGMLAGLSLAFAVAASAAMNPAAAQAEYAASKAEVGRPPLGALPASLASAAAHVRARETVGDQARASVLASASVTGPVAEAVALGRALAAAAFLAFPRFAEVAICFLAEMSAQSRAAACFSVMMRPSCGASARLPFSS